MKKVLLSLVVLLLAYPSMAQVSIGLQYGFGSPTEGDDAYFINSSWPIVNSNGNSSDGNSTKYYSASSGSSALATLTWEASPHIGVALVYRMTKFSNSSEGREGSLNSWGVQFKVNFVDNSKKVVPFFQTEYFFLNSSTVTQVGMTSTKFLTQTSPSFNQTMTTNLGVGGDLGVEIKLSQPFSLIITGGVHGVEMASSEGNAFISSLNYGTDATGNVYQAPKNFDGVFWVQGTGGIKYYLGKGKKKRDF